MGASTNNTPDNSKNSDWQPTASLLVLQERAAMFAQIRRFFADRAVMEVDTPLLSLTTVTDPHIETFCFPAKAGRAPRWLQSSPEFAMKRLLAAGSGAIYQLGKAFREEECGARHNPEFTLLEWYQPGYDHWQLMDEVAALLMQLLACSPPQRLTYLQAFERFLNIDPHRASLCELRELAGHKVAFQGDSDDRDFWLDLLLSHCIEPHLGKDAPLFLHDYPASQAALARLRKDDSGTMVAERFELYIQGVEIANGYRELIDADEQALRFQRDIQQREKLAKPAVPIDQRLLGALKHGMSECAGVALGVDRLLMVKLGLDRIEKVISFAADQA